MVYSQNPKFEDRMLKWKKIAYRRTDRVNDFNRNFALLKSLGFEDSDRWILYEDSCKEFFEWFTQNISNDNILTDLELKEYNDLKKDGAVLEGETLEQQMLGLKEKYPNILHYTDDDVKNQVKNLEELFMIEESYETVAIDMKATRSRITKEITDLEAQIIDAKYQEEKFYEDGIEKSLALNELQKLNHQLFVELNQCYTKTQTPPLFVYQMPLDQYNIKCEQFLKYFELYMRKNFDIKDYMENESESETKNEFIKKLDGLKQRLFAADVKLNEENINIRGANKILKEFSEYDHKNWSKKSANDLESKNKLTEIQMNALKQDLEVYLRRVSDLEIENVLHENNKLKLARANERLKNAKQMAAIVSDSISNAELLWVLMQFDLEKIKNKFDNTDQMQQAAIECTKRIEQLKKLPKSSQEAAKEYFVEEFSNILATHLQKPMDNFYNLKECFEEYENLRRNIVESLESVVGKKYYENIDEVFAEIFETEAILNTYLYDGPVNKPQFCDPKYLHRIFEANKTNEMLIRNMKKFKDDYKKNVQEKDRYYRSQNILWIWFLTEPKKLLVAIKEVTAAAAKTQSTAFKNITGIIRKN